MNRNAFSIFVVSVFLFTACAAFNTYDAAVTTTEVVDTAMKDWATLSVAGKTTPEIDAKVIAAHRVYQQSAVAARDALVVFKNSGDQTAYQKALQAARTAMNTVLEIVLPLLQPPRQVELQSKMGRAMKI